MSVRDDEHILRRLARDQWVRVHGTPRVTVLAGGETARRIWTEWAAVGQLDAELVDGSADFAKAFRDAVDRAGGDPARPIAVLAPEDAIARWQPIAPDRLRVLVSEGLLAIREPEQKPASSTGISTRIHIDARSAAEAALFEALEATSATAGRFELNGRLAFRFGSDAAEVDLLSRRDGIAIEIDGYHHFTDAEHYRRDRQKDLLLQMQGLLVIRLLAEDVMREPVGAVKAVCHALAFRGNKNA